MRQGHQHFTAPGRALPRMNVMWPLLLLRRRIARDSMRRRRQEVIEMLLHDGAANDFILNDFLRLTLEK
jgi:hypothetical protein